MLEVENKRSLAIFPWPFLRDYSKHMEVPQFWLVYLNHMRKGRLANKGTLPPTESSDFLWLASVHFTLVSPVPYTS